MIVKIRGKSGDLNIAFSKARYKLRQFTEIENNKNIYYFIIVK
jgi:hypothetical protein